MARILLLDGDSDSRLMVTRFLQLHHHHVTAFETVEQVPVAEDAGGFAVAVINDTPGVGGLERLVETVTQANSGIKVIAVTNATPDRVKEDSLAHEVIFRPVELATIETAIERLLNS